VSGNHVKGLASPSLALSDSTTQDQTAAAQWSSSDPSKASVSSGGVITAVAPGNAVISAAVQGLTARQAIAVSVACDFSISPAAVSFTSSGGTQIVAVGATPAGCSPSTWTAVASDAGLTFTPATGEGSGSVTVTAAPNAGAAQTRRATVAGQPLTVSLAAAALPPMRTLRLSLTQGENLSGPWAGTVTGPDGYSCSLSQSESRVSCAPLAVKDGTTLELVVTLAPRLVDLGKPIRLATGCDALTQNVCRLVMNADRSVVISIGCSIC
jgi:hypothetical protein